MVSFAGAELGNRVNDAEFARCGEAAESFGAHDGAELGEREARFIGDGDERFAFVGVWPGDDRDLTARAELRFAKSV